MTYILVISDALVLKIFDEREVNWLRESIIEAIYYNW